MAPEFFPLVASFVAFVGLCASVLLMLVAGTGLQVWAVYYARHRRALRVGSACFFCGALVFAVPLSIVGHYIRQEYFLNEPLVIASGNGDVTEVRRLLQRGASPDADDSDGTQTALMAAAVCGNRDIVTLLLGAGADIRLTNSKGKTAAQIARGAGHEDVALMIEQSRQAK